MTRKEELTYMLAKVEAGEFDARTYPLMKLPQMSFDTFQNIHRAYNGSLTAAEAFHESVLPEWDACVYLSGHAWIYKPNRNAPPAHEHRASNSVAARALLICDIKALIAECDE